MPMKPKSLTGNENLPENDGLSEIRSSPGEFNESEDKEVTGEIKTVSEADLNIPRFLPLAETMPVRRRSSFSSRVFQLKRRHADRESASSRRQIGFHDPTLHLIDDLTNRSMDPMWDDSMLLRDTDSKTKKNFIRIITFAICVCVSFAGVSVLSILHANSRAKVRTVLANQLNEKLQSSRSLENDVASVHSQIEELSKKENEIGLTEEQIRENILNGTAAVEGPGIEAILANPQTSDSAESETAKNVTDAELQLFVSRLWAAGAEAIAINDVRLTSTSSIREAGSSMFAGLTAVNSPYVLHAIGDKNQLTAVIDEKHNPLFYDLLRNKGITVSVQTKDDISMRAANDAEIKYAKGKE